MVKSGLWTGMLLPSGSLENRKRFESGPEAPSSSPGFADCSKTTESRSLSPGHFLWTKAATPHGPL